MSPVAGCVKTDRLRGEKRNFERRRSRGGISEYKREHKGQKGKKRENERMEKKKKPVRYLKIKSGHINTEKRFFHLKLI